MRKHMWVLGCVLLAAGCGQDGGGGAVVNGCIGSFLGADVTRASSGGSCSICGDDARGASVDGNAESFATVRLGNGSIGLRATAPAGKVFPAGRFAGALMEIPAAYSPQTTWTFTTYRNGIAQETRSAANADGADPESPPAGPEFYGLITALEFDAVEFTLNGGVPAVNTDGVPVVRVYEFCGDR
jgi:hypothetical protein